MAKVIQIDNWRKINGIAYKNFLIGSPSHSPDYKIYNANIYDLRTVHKSSIWLTMVYNEYIQSFNVTIMDTVSNYQHTELLPLQNAKKVSGFIRIYEALIDQYNHDIKR
jgi:hypothetical protein